MLVKTSNPSSVEISEATNIQRQKIRDWLADYVNISGQNCVGEYGYSAIGAQGGSAKDVVSCFNEDGLGAIVSSSRDVLYKHLDIEEFDNSRSMYTQIVKKQAQNMQQMVYQVLKAAYTKMVY